MDDQKSEEVCFWCQGAGEITGPHLYNDDEIGLYPCTFCRGDGLEKSYSPTYPKRLSKETLRNLIDSVVEKMDEMLKRKK